MNPIAILDMLSILAGLTGLYWVISRKGNLLRSDSRLILSILLIVIIGYNCFMMVEWLGIVNTMESVENMIGTMIPMLWAFVFYSFIQKGILHDIRRNEENLRITLNSIGDAVIATDTKGRITRMNPVAESITGYSFEEVQCRKLNEIIRVINPVTRERIKDPVETVIETGRKVSLSQQPILVSRDGKEYFISDSASPIFNAECEVIGVVLVFSDFTEKYLQAEKIKENEERLNLAIQGTRAGMWDWNIRTGTMVCNEQWAHMIGYELSELEPITHKVVEKFVHPEDLVVSGELLDEHFKGNSETYECEIRVKHKDGHWVWTVERGMVVEREPGGSPLRMTGTLIDFTRQKQAETELKTQIERNFSLNDAYLNRNKELKESLTRIQRINEELTAAKLKAEESDRLKSAFLANMSHEIRTPMNGIIGFSEMLADPSIIPENRAEYARIVIDSSRQLLHIVNDILDISRIEAGLLQLVKEEFSLNQLIHMLFAFFEPQARSKNLLLSTHCALSTQESVIYTDKTRLRQILTNLLNNSLKFTSAGEISFGYTCRDKELLFYVRDTGTGIKPELHEVIFQPFMQAELEISSHFGGTGLGLSISRKLVEWLGGKIWLESTKGAGSTFYFTILFEKAESPPFQAEDEATESSLMGENLELLVAEDDDTNFLFVETLLEKQNIRILRARNGNQAVEMCKKNKHIRMILMDIKMPDLNGYDATRMIKKIRPELPIVALTAYAMNEDKVRVFEAGCDDYLSKPVKKAELLSIVEKYVLKQPTES